MHDHVHQHDQSKLPTRVIDVSRGLGPDTVHLHCTSLEELGQYAALSYCWGDSPQPIVLAEGTLGTLVGGIQVSKLPQTIVDSIIVARDLGLRYLWIDALCIQQDSDADKERELAQMASTYQHAHVTIAAANASGVREGFLQARIDVMNNGRWIKLPFGKLGHTHGISATRSLNPDTEPLNQRGWTLQEGLLSPRVLLFDSQIMRWECPEHQDMERWGAANLVLRNYGGIDPLRFDDRRIGGNRSDSTYYSRWGMLVGLYTARHIRYGCDKLPAISAIAQQAATFLPTRYIAGLWEAHLKEDLMWEIESYRPTDEGYVPPRHRGPSWSWISVDSPIKHRPCRDFECKILKCEANLVNQDLKFGEVRNGMLKIRGRLAKATSSNRERLWRCHRPEDKNQDNHWTEVFSFDRQEDNDRRRDWKNTFLLELCEREGMILEKMSDGKYRRIGLYSWRRDRRLREHGWVSFRWAWRRTITIV